MNRECNDNWRDEFQHVAPQHPGQANDIWIGYLSDQTHVAIRLPKRTHGTVEPFYDGIKHLFGYEYGMAYHYQNMYRLLRKHSLIPIPELLSIKLPHYGDFAPMHHFVAGQPLQTFSALTPVGAHLYGQHLGHIHLLQTTTYGAFGTLQTRKPFHIHASDTIRHLISHYPYDAETKHALQKASQYQIKESPHQTYAPILVDLDPTQFFSSSGQLTHLIDIDFVLFGPPEFELVALERHLTPPLAAAFERGYSRIRRFPHLAETRSLYRALQRALCLHGNEPVTAWRDTAIRFK